MPGFKRTRSTSGSSSSSYNTRSHKVAKSIGKRISPGTKIYIVQAKLSSPAIAKLFRLAESLTTKLCKNAEDADVIITAIGMQKRLERHIPAQQIREKVIVTPEWLEDSVKNGKSMPYSKYAALNTNSTDTDTTSMEPNARVALTHSASPSADFDHTALFACQRASPLFCPNQELVSELSIIRRSRELDGIWRSALSYQRAIAALKACPYEITDHKEASKLPYIGPKITRKVEEYLTTEHISESQTILKDEKYHVLDAFTSIYGIGPTTARNLYAKGLRTLQDLQEHYAVPPDLKSTIQRDQDEPVLTESWVDVSLALKDDLSVKIPRKEVEEICEQVMKELNEIQSGCSYTIVGGYRRGKSESNDVDIVFTHPDTRKVGGLCRKLTERLCDKGLVTHLMTMTGLNTPGSSHQDVLEKALTIFSLPGSNKSHRLDLIFAIPEVYWTAVVGWTGSTMFERDLRLYAKSKNLKFDSSGITRRRDESFIVANSEEEVFEILGLKWIDPTLRNADA